MNALRAVLIAAAVLAVAGQYLAELRRLRVVQRLPAQEARRYHETARRRSERVMLVVTVLLAAAAVAACAYLLLAA